MGRCRGEEELEAGVSEHAFLGSSVHSYGRRHVVGTGGASGGSVGQIVMRVGVKGQLMGVENFVTHNGECDCRDEWETIISISFSHCCLHTRLRLCCIPSQVTLNSTRLEASITTVKPSKNGLSGLFTLPCPLQLTRPPLRV